MSALTSYSNAPDSPSVAARADLTARLRQLRPEIRRSVESIAGPLSEPSHLARPAALDIVAGLANLASVNPVGNVLQAQTVHVVALILGSPRGASLAEILAAFNENQAAAFRAVCTISAEVRR